MKINAYMARMNKAYLFADIAHRVDDYRAAHPDKEIIRLGIGDVTKPLTPHVAKAFADSALSMGTKEGFRGYPPYEGYDFLLDAIIEKEYAPLGVRLNRREIFVSDGAKTDTGSIQELFSPDTRVAVTDPVYPVYVDSNVMAGRTGTYDPATGIWSNVIYMPCTADNHFAPEIPSEQPDLIYLCFPNNPTGATITRDQMQEWVDYANRIGAVILYDAAYEAYITEGNVPHSIYECEGARTCAIEMRSFSKNAGFTGLRLGYVVIPKELKDRKGQALHPLWARRHGTKYNGAPYIVQRAGEAVYSEAGKAQVREMVGKYMENARFILDSLKSFGYEASGGVNSPYVWLRAPGNMTSWEFFDHLLEKANVVGTPGSGFGPSGEHYFRLTAFGTYENSVEAMERIRKL